MSIKISYLAYTVTNQTSTPDFGLRSLISSRHSVREYLLFIPQLRLQRLIKSMPLSIKEEFIVLAYKTTQIVKLMGIEVIHSNTG